MFNPIICDILQVRIRHEIFQVPYGTWLCSIAREWSAYFYIFHELVLWGLPREALAKWGPFTSYGNTKSCTVLVRENPNRWRSGSKIVIKSSRHKVKSKIGLDDFRLEDFITWLLPRCLSGSTNRGVKMESSTQDTIKQLHYQVFNSELGLPVCAQGCQHSDGRPQTHPCLTAQAVLNESEMASELLSMSLG